MDHTNINFTGLRLNEKELQLFWFLFWQPFLS
jgi:hypothetical protein